MPGRVNGYSVTVSSDLAGAKAAVRRGGTLFVSPAMWDLISTAESAEDLAFVMTNIPIVTLAPPGYVVPVYSAVYVLTHTGPNT